MYEITPVTGLYLLQYLQSLLGAGITDGATAPEIFTRTNFQSSFVLLFDLSRNGEPHAPYINSPEDARNLQMQASFSTGAAQDTTMLAIGFFQGSMEITSSYEPLMSF